jgi:hypothetical protein
MKINKKLLFGGIAGLIVIGGGALWYFSKKKKLALELEEAASESAGSGSESEVTTPVVSAPSLASGDINLSPSGNTGFTGGLGLDQTTNTPTPNTTSTASSNIATNTAKILQVIKDGSKGKAIIQVSPKGLFKTGDKAKVNGSVYKGTYAVWYVFKTNPAFDNVYIDTPFISSDTGTVTK